jgi:hypothetical protein
MAKNQVSITGLTEDNNYWTCDVTAKYVEDLSSEQKINGEYAVVGQELRKLVDETENGINGFSKVADLNLPVVNKKNIRKQLRVYFHTL